MKLQPGEQSTFSFLSDHLFYYNKRHIGADGTIV
jgi:hypothetical protein